MTELTNMTEEAPKCPMNFGLWVAFLAGMVAMVIAAVVFDRVSGRTRSGSDTPEYQQYAQDIVKTNSVVVVEQQKESGAWLGIEVQEINDAIAKELGLNRDSGVLVTKVVKGSPAEAGGIQRGDVIVMFDRRWVKDIQSLKMLLAKVSVGDRVKVDVIRDGRRKALYVEIGSIPNNTTGFELLQGQPGGMSQGRGLGVTISPLTPQLAQRFGILRNEQGIVIVEVAPYSIAQRAGLQAGDVIRGVNGQGTQDMASFMAAIATEKAALLDISRQGQDDYVIIDSTAITPNLPGNLRSSFNVGGILTGGSSEEESEEGYKGKPPIIPPMGKPPEPETPQINGTITSVEATRRVAPTVMLPVAGSTQSLATSAITTVSMLYTEHLEGDESDKPQCKRLQEQESL